MKALKYTLFLSIAMFIACTKPPDYSDTPEIAFISLSETTMTQGSQNEEFITLTISFTDGDGDIGIDGGEPSVYFKDLRDGSEFITFVVSIFSQELLLKSSEYCTKLLLCGSKI